MGERTDKCDEGDVAKQLLGRFRCFPPAPSTRVTGFQSLLGRHEMRTRPGIRDIPVLNHTTDSRDQGTTVCCDPRWREKSISYRRRPEGSSLRQGKKCTPVVRISRYLLHANKTAEPIQCSRSTPRASSKGALP